MGWGIGGGRHGPAGVEVAGRDGMEGFGGSRGIGVEGMEEGGPKPGIVCRVFGRERDEAVCTVGAAFAGGVGGGR